MSYFSRPIFAIFAISLLSNCTQEPLENRSSDTTVIPKFDSEFGDIPYIQPEFFYRALRREHGENFAGLETGLDEYGKSYLRIEGYCLHVGSVFTEWRNENADRIITRMAMMLLLPRDLPAPITQESQPSTPDILYPEPKELP